MRDNEIKELIITSLWMLVSVISALAGIILVITITGCDTNNDDPGDYPTEINYADNDAGAIDYNCYAELPVQSYRAYWGDRDGRTVITTYCIEERQDEFMTQYLSGNYESECYECDKLLGWVITDPNTGYINGWLYMEGYDY